MPKPRGKPSSAIAWAATARGDLDQIIGYIMARDPINALNVLNDIEDRANALEQLPQRGRVVPELQFHGVMTYREFIIKPWRLIYRVDGQRVWVLSILDGRRQLDDLLLERFLFLRG